MYNKQAQKYRGFLARAMCAMLVGMSYCSAFAVDDASTNNINKDPYEKFNRAMFSFNDNIDTYIMKPVATFYNTIMPRPLNEGVHNFFNNINNLPTIADDLLQANFQQAASDTWRFTINSTIGILGFFDVAERIQLKQYNNDFGLTLAKWGYRDSNYLVLPFWGPSTIRDGIGLPVDYFAFSVYPYIYPDKTRYGIYLLGAVDVRTQLLKYQDVMDVVALDRYTFVRNAYMQKRAYMIKQSDQGGPTKTGDKGTVLMTTMEPVTVGGGSTLTPLADTVDSESGGSTLAPLDDSSAGKGGGSTLAPLNESSLPKPTLPINNNKTSITLKPADPAKKITLPIGGAQAANKKRHQPIRA